MGLHHRFRVVLAPALSFAVLSLAAFPGASARADGLPSDVQAFCDDPYAAICGPAGELGHEYDARFAGMKRALYDQAMRQAAFEFDFSPADDSGYEAYAKAHPERAAELLARFQSLMRSGAVSEAGGPALAWQSALESRVQAELSSVLESVATLTSADRARFQAALAALRIVDSAEIVAAGERHPLWPNFVYQCSVNGLRDNAFHPPNADVLVLCPGMLLAARPDASRSASAQDMFAGVVWTLSHETGHEIDNGSFSMLYAPLRECVEQEFVRTGVLHGFSELAPGSAEYRERLEAHLEEIAADTWANETMARLVESRGGGEAGLALVKSATVGLCGLRDNEVRYGSDRFRLGVLLGRNPRLRRALGCGGLPAGQATCVFEGRAD